MRNIAYLKLAESLPANDRLLCLFVDSDQEFQTVIEANGEERQIYALNYFYELDRIFTQQDISVVTGKVVGDPPVSPAVMAGTFLDDIILFLQQISTEGAENSCCMHHQTQQQEHAASYHDLAELFGFSPPTTATRYRCRLTGAHHNAACFSDFAGRLNAFLYGEHPTRKTYFDPKMGVSEVSPARTIYTGNYVMKRACLDYFIPFAGLKLRMAGPVLGRIIKSEIGAQFVSANLPLLHNRTLEESGSSEFRLGVAISDERIDLCGEFERQFFGDVMLFSIERLTQLGFPKCHIDRAQIMQKLITTAEELRAQYADKQRAIETKLERLRSLFEASDHWWNRDPELADACERFRTFITNLAHNFAGDSACYQSIDTPAIRHDWLNRMADAILSYPDDRQAWQRILLRRRP